MPLRRDDWMGCVGIVLVVAGALALVAWVMAPGQRPPVPAGDPRPWSLADRRWSEKELRWLIRDEMKRDETPK